MMRRLQTFILISGVLAAVFVLALGALPDDVRPGQNEPVSEVKVVRNPAEPEHGRVVLELIEDLSIGGEDDEHAYF